MMNTHNSDKYPSDPVNKVLDVLDGWAGDDAGRVRAIFLGGAGASLTLGVAAEAGAQALRKSPTILAKLGQNSLHLIAAGSVLAAGGSTFLAGYVSGEEQAVR